MFLRISGNVVYGHGSEMVPDPRLSFLFYTLFFISGKINKYERQYKAGCLLKLTVSSDPYTSTQTAHPRPAGAWRGRNSGNRTWWPCIFTAVVVPGDSQQVADFFCSRRALRGSDSGNYSSRGAENCCFHRPSILSGFPISCGRIVRISQPSSYSNGWIFGYVLLNSSHSFSGSAAGSSVSCK